MLEIKFTIDLSDRAISVIEELTRSLNHGKPTVVSTPKVEAPKVEAPKAEAPKVEAPKVEAPKVEAPKVEAPKAEAPKAEAPKAEAPKAEAPKAEAHAGTLKIEDIRALLRLKVNNDENRAKLKTKLDSLGVANVTTLAKEHYDEFYKFMSKLP